MKNNEETMKKIMKKFANVYNISNNNRCINNRLFLAGLQEGSESSII